MSRFLKASALGLAALAVAGPVSAEGLGLGREATPDEVAAWNIDIRPDGTGLPEGSGDVFTGEEIFTEKCAVCHGDFGEGAGRWPVLAGGRGTLTSSRPVKTVGSYWPYLSTVWDYVHRAMPFGDAQSLSADETYALVAYILYLNDIVDDEFELSKENFLEIEMPNAAGFYADDREQSPIWAADDACMENCKTDVKITMHAAVLDVTPESEGGGGLEGGDLEGGGPAPEASAGTEASVEVAAAETTAPAATPTAAAIDEELAAAGEKVFRKCKSCHQIGEGAKNRTGPILNGVVGAPVGHIEDFRYSNAFRELHDGGAVWDEAALDAFLAKPRDFAKGTRMFFAGLKKAEDRAAVIEYLRAASD